MLRSAFLFVRERFRLSVSVPLALLLCLGSLEHPFPGSWPRLALCVWLLLFCARAVDDIADRRVDALRKPERALPSGRITVRALASSAGLAFAAALLLLGRQSISAGCAVAAYALAILSFYRVRSRISAVLGPPLVNGIFLLVTMLGPLESARVSGQALLFAGFVWLSTVGHDFAHGIEDNPSPEPGMTPLRRARWGAVFFTGASAAGGLFSALAHEPLFAWLLGATSVWLIVLLWGLIRAPSERAARRIYVPGFLYFLLPMLGRIGHGWLG